jgi:hypothetical protein
MNGALSTYIGASLTFGWGVSRLFPTRHVVSGLGDITQTTIASILMERIAAGMALVLVVAVCDIYRSKLLTSG